MATPLRVFDRGGEAMGKGVGDAVEGEEPIDAGLTDFLEKLLQRQALAVGQDEVVVVDQVDDLLVAQVRQQQAPGGGPGDRRVFADVRGNAEMPLALLHQRHGVFAPVEQAHLRGFVGLADDLLQGVIGLAGQVEMTQMRLAEEVQLTAEVDVTVLAHRFQNPPFQQRGDQFVDRGFRAADAAGDIIRAQGLADFLEEIEDIERPVQTAGPAFDGVFGHVSGSHSKCREFTAECSGDR